MSDTPATAPGQRSLWLRGLFMVLMAMAFHLAATLLALLALVQFVLALLSGTPNARLRSFGQSLGQYLRQIADFVSFGTEELPFPFSDCGARQATCRLIHAASGCLLADAECALTTQSRSGFRVTEPTGVRFLVVRDQRRGLRWRAWQYSS